MKQIDKFNNMRRNLGAPPFGDGQHAGESAEQEPDTKEGLLKQFEELGAPPRSPATFLHIVLTVGIFNWLVSSSHEDFPILLFILIVLVGSYTLTIRECNKLNKRINVMWKILHFDKKPEE